MKFWMRESIPLATLRCLINCWRRIASMLKRCCLIHVSHSWFGKQVGDLILPWLLYYEWCLREVPWVLEYLRCSLRWGNSRICRRWPAECSANLLCLRHVDDVTAYRHAFVRCKRIVQCDATIFAYENVHGATNCSQNLVLFCPLFTNYPVP